MSVLQLPALDPTALEEVGGSGYPPPYRDAVQGRARRRLGDPCGLKQFGVNLTTLQPGSQSAQRHWHTQEDEFVYVLAGEVVLITDAGEQLLRPGQCAGFPAGTRDGHCLVNRSDQIARYLEIGSRVVGDTCAYPGIDLITTLHPDGERYAHRDGTPY